MKKWKIWANSVVLWPTWARSTIGHEDGAKQRQTDGHGREEIDGEGTFAEQAPTDLLLGENRDLTPPERPTVGVAAAHDLPPPSPMR